MELALCDFTTDDPNPRLDSLKSGSWFHRLISVAGDTCGLTFDHFLTGQTIFAISLDKSDLAQNSVGPTEVGALSLDIEFSDTSDSGIYVYALGLFRDTITIEPKLKLLSTSYAPQNFG